MKRIIIMSSLLLLLVLPLASADSEYSDDWEFRKEITIDHTKVTDNLIDFPILISLSSDVSLAAYGLDNGDDILFADNGVNENIQLDHEIENFVSDNGQLVTWIRIPTLSDSEDTVIWMYYGNPTALNQENAEGVWDDDYEAVWHMSEADAEDSTTNQYDGTASGNTTDSGIIGNAQSFDNSSYISTGEFIADFGGVVTLSAWVKHSDTSSHSIILGKGNGDNIWEVNEKIFFIQPSSGAWPPSDPPGSVNLEGHSNGSVDGNENVSTDSWRSVCITYDSGDTGYVYVDGNLDNTDSYSGADNPTDDVFIGADSIWYFDGLIDEVRISDEVRSSDWIKTRFNNEDDPSSFYSLGGQLPEEPHIQVNYVPSIVLPREIFYVTSCLHITGDNGENITAVLHTSNDTPITGFIFLDDYGDNDTTIDNCGIDNMVSATWLIAAPTGENVEQVYVEWGFYHGTHPETIYSDNIEIQVTSFTPPSVAITELERDFVIIFLVILNILMILIIRIPYLQIFIALASTVVAALLNNTTAFPWLNLLLIVTAIYSIVDTYKSVK